MTFLPEGSNSENDWPHRSSRLGPIPGSGGCRGLDAPGILWDTRNHDGTSMSYIDEDYPAGDQLINEGTLGDEWDLDIEMGWYDNTGNSWYYLAYKTLNWPNSFGTSGTNFPDGWADLGGTPCEAGGLTWMMAISDWAIEDDYSLFQATGSSSFLPEYLGYIESEILSDNNGAGEVYLQVRTLGSPEGNVGDAPTSEGWDIFHGIYLFVAYAEWYSAYPDLDGNFPELINCLLTIHYDFESRQAWFWFNETLILTAWLSEPSPNPIDPLGENWYYDTFANGDCRDEFGAATDVIDELFTYFGEAGPSREVPPVGKAWQPIKGAAMFRGCGPSAEDMAYWYDYWFPAGGGDQDHVQRLVYITREGHLNNQAAHQDDYTIPAWCTNVSIMWENNATIIAFDVNVSPGDVLRFELGGGGNHPAQTGAEGKGGWPDGGDGGTAVGTPARTGYGGQGSTKIYLDTGSGFNLIAHIGGAGGGALRFLTSGSFSTVKAYGGGIQDPTITLDGGSASDNVTGAPVGVNHSTGATPTTPGTGGTNSGQSGSGSNGGDGQNNTQSTGTERHSGGGGGGGGVRGGGGGGTAAGSTTEPGGGSAGSSWYDTGVCLNLEARILTERVIGASTPQIELRLNP